MHRKFAGQGVVFVSLSVDPPERRPKVQAFLEKQNATFANYLLDEEQEFWQERFGVKAPPAVLVFGKDGKLVRRFDTEDPRKPYSYEDVEKLVKDLLRPGP